MGKISRPHGIKGELEICWSGEYQPKPGDRIFIGQSPQDASRRLVTGVRPQKDRLLVRLDGLEDRSGAEKLRGLAVYMAGQDLPPLADDEVYLRDLPGCAVFLENGRHLGMLDHLEFPANRIVWAIQGDNGQEILFPANPEFIKSIDAEKREIVISPPDGLLEVYGA